MAVLLAIAAFLWISCLTFDPNDYPNPFCLPHNDPTANWCGPTGAWLSYHLFYYFGRGGWAILLFATILSLMSATRIKGGELVLRLAGMVLLVVVTSGVSTLLEVAGRSPLVGGSGGVVGLALVGYLEQYFFAFGTALFLMVGLAFGLILAADEVVVYLPKVFRRTAEMAAGTAGRGWRKMIEEPRRPKALPAPAKPATRAIPAAEGPTGDDEHPVETVEAELAEPFATPDVKLQTPEPAPAADPPAGRPQAGEAATESAEPPVERPEPKISISKLSLPKRETKPEAWPKDLGDWQLPPVELLSDERQVLPADHEQQVREKARVLERTLAEFKIDAAVVEIDTGPVVTLFELSLGPGIKVKSIAERARDLARAMKSPSVRVVAPIPGKNTIGIEVPNIEKQPVRLRELMEGTGANHRKMNIPLFIGKDASGNGMVYDLTAMPHLLIAGTTGSGKSVCINSLIMSILLTQRPDHVKLIMVDPKMVELSTFKDIPHLMCPVVHEVERAESILEWLVQKMEERYAILAEAQVRHIHAFNSLGREALLERLRPANEEEAARIQTHIPYILLVIDELADLMMVSPKEVELHLARLAQKSRAVGIHIILATQRPEAKVVTGLIKSNLPCRIAFRVSSRLDSRIVLDQNGAEDLLGAGDMLFLPPGSSKTIRAQGAWVDDGELKRVLAHLHERGEPEFHRELMELGKVDLGALEQDEMFDEAVRIILTSQRGSSSLLQRRLGVGYSRASRLIEQMAQAGIVGEYRGSQARDVLMTLDEYEALKSQMAQEVADGLTD